MSAKSLRLEMVTPERPVLSEAADFVVLPALEGEMGVLPGHAPFLVQLREGEVRVRAGVETKHYAVSGGFAEVGRGKVSVFAETAEMAEEIDVARAQQALARAKAAAGQAKADDLTLAQAEAAVRRAALRLRLAELRGRRPTPPRTG